MIQLYKFTLFLMLCINLSSCDAQTTKVDNNSLSADFDRSPPVYYKMPAKVSSVDTSPAWNKPGEKILLTGIVFKRDRKTPASDVILYYYQTDVNGIYKRDVKEPFNMPANQLGQTHGYIRGWVKTGDDGKYSIFTTKPGSYPGRNEPAHIHVYVIDKNLNEPYYIDDFVFDNDRLLTSERRNKLENRGGSGVIRFVADENILIGERDIYLGLNIPNYSEVKANKMNSGKNVGEDVSSFTPYHVYGPDKGTKTCPICKYGWYNGILYFVGNNPNWTNIKKWLTFLEKESVKREQYLKAYFVYSNENEFDKETCITRLEKIGEELQLIKTALTIVPSFIDRSSDIYLNRINPEVENTFLIYKRSKIVDKFINLEPRASSFNKLIKSLDLSNNEYFKMPRENMK